MSFLVDLSLGVREAELQAENPVMYQCQTLEETYLQWLVVGEEPVLSAMLLLHHYTFRPGAR